MRHVLFFVRYIHAHLYPQKTLIVVDSSVGGLILQISSWLPCIKPTRTYTCMTFWNCNDRIRPMTFEPWAL